MCARARANAVVCPARRLVVDRGRLLRDGPELPCPWPPSTSCSWSCDGMPATALIPSWGFISMEPTLPPGTRARLGSRRRWPRLAIMIPGAPAYRGSSSPRGCLRPQVGTPPPLPHPRSHRLRGRGSHLRQCHGQAGIDLPHLREPRPASPVKRSDRRSRQWEHERGELAMSGTARRAPLRHAGHG